jgi:hypothetical protein
LKNRKKYFFKKNPPSPSEEEKETLLGLCASVTLKKGRFHKNQSRRSCFLEREGHGFVYIKQRQADSCGISMLLEMQSSRELL